MNKDKLITLAGFPVMILIAILFFTDGRKGKKVISTPSEEPKKDALADEEAMKAKIRREMASKAGKASAAKRRAKKANKDAESIDG